GLSGHVLQLQLEWGAYVFGVNTEHCTVLITPGQHFQPNSSLISPSEAINRLIGTFSSFIALPFHTSPIIKVSIHHAAHQVSL
ncbi:hypothetical protein, partial [Yersinia aldovae]|uniref:hypothetical protein n=1 Tax=Yersinia aldovae TaxID=29483 RepID=UPI001C98A824